MPKLSGRGGGAPLSNATQVVEGDNLVHACCVVDVSADVDVDVDIDIDVDANLIMIVWTWQEKKCVRQHKWAYKCLSDFIVKKAK